MEIIKIIKITVTIQMVCQIIQIQIQRTSDNMTNDDNYNSSEHSNSLNL